MKLRSGQITPEFTAEDLAGTPISMENFKGKKTAFAFLRNTRCPLCSWHLNKLLGIMDKLREQNMQVIVVYESRKEMFLRSSFFKEILMKQEGLYIISDTKRELYDLYGAEISPEKATMEALQAANRLEEIAAAGKDGFTGDALEPGTHPDAIPADFLIDEELIIRHAHYGNDAGDHISLELIEVFAMNGVIVNNG